MMKCISFATVVAILAISSLCTAQPVAGDEALKDAIKVLRGHLEKSKTDAEKQRINEAIGALEEQLKRPAVADAVQLKGDLYADLADNPKKYKGKTITARVVYLEFEKPLRGGGLLELQASFRDIDEKLVQGSVTLKFRVDVPKDENHPNAKFTDQLIITFICTEGSLEKGNKLLSVKRAK